MEQALWPIDFRLEYPEGCTRKDVRDILTMWACEWPGWDSFPWRCTRNIHRYVNELPLKFQSVMLHRWVCGQSSWLVLHGEFEDRNAVLDMMVRESFQLFGVHRAMLIDSLRYEMRFSKREYILDCAGPEDGHDHHSPEEIAARRRTFRECIEGACRDTARIVNVASQTENMDEWILGRRLRTWARGGDVPDRVDVAVRIEKEQGRTVVVPNAEEAKAIIRAGKKVPRVCVGGGKTEVKGQRSEVACGDVEGADPPSPEASAGKGKGAGLSEEEANLQRAAAAVELATSLDSNPRVKSPTHACVLGLYVKGYSIKKMKEALKCSQGTVANRLDDLEARLGPLAAFRNLGPMINGLQKAKDESMARRVSPKALMG